MKRVIGLPGETISQRGATIEINGVPVAQPWLPKMAGICAQSSKPVPTTKIPAGQYFVMGDCRGDFSDMSMMLIRTLHPMKSQLEPDENRSCAFGATENIAVLKADGSGTPTSSAISGGKN